MKFLQVEMVVLIFLCSFLASCELNAVRPVESSKATLPFLRKTVVVLGLDTSSYNSEQAADLEIDRVNKNGTVSGGGCFRYDHLSAQKQPSMPGVTFFAFVAPPGLYSLARSSGVTCDDEQYAWAKPTCGKFNKAYYIKKGVVSYIGIYKLSSFYVPNLHGNQLIISHSENLRAAQQWAGNRFDSSLEQAALSQETPQAFPFLCTP